MADPTVQSGLLFPDFTDGGIGTVAKFLYWFDFASRNVVRSSNPNAVHAIVNRDDAVAPVVVGTAVAGNFIAPSTINGKAAALGHTSNYMAGASALTSLKGCTMFAVFEGGGTGDIIFRIHQGGTVRMALEVDNATFVTTDVSLVNSAFNDTTDGGRHLVVIKWDGADVFAKVDDSQFVDVGNFTTNLGNADTVNLLGDGSTNMVGKVGEVLFTHEVLNNTKVNLVGRYLRDKWGATWADAV